MIKFINNFLSNIKSEMSEGKYQRSKSKINNFNIENNLLKKEAESLTVKRENFLLKNEIDQDQKIIDSGKRITTMAFLTYLVSTSLSLVSGYELLNEDFLSFIPFAAIMTICQTIVYVVSAYENTIRTRFFTHYGKIKLIQMLLLIVSITLNELFFWTFFKNILIAIIMFPLCVCLDLATLEFSALGFDKKNLRFSNLKNIRKTTLEMFFYNLLNPLRSRIEAAYNKNINFENSKVDFGKKPLDDIEVPKFEIGIPKLEENKSNIDQNLSKVEAESSKVDLEESNIDFGNSNIDLEKEVVNISTLRKNELNDSDKSLIEEIDRYILNKYNKDDVINTKNIIEKFKISNYKYRILSKHLTNITISKNKRTIAN